MARHQGKWRCRRRRRRWWPEECRAKLRERESEKGRKGKGGHKNEWLSTGAMCNMSPTATATLPSGPSHNRPLPPQNTFRPESREGRGGPSNEYCYGKLQWCNTIQIPWGISIDCWDNIENYLDNCEIIADYHTIEDQTIPNELKTCWN